MCQLERNLLQGKYSVHFERILTKVLQASGDNFGTNANAGSI